MFKRSTLLMMAILGFTSIPCFAESNPLTAEEYCQKVQTNPTVKRFIEARKKDTSFDNLELDGQLAKFVNDSANKLVAQKIQATNYKPSDKAELLQDLEKGELGLLTEYYQEIWPVLENSINQCRDKLANTEYKVFFERGSNFSSASDADAGIANSARGERGWHLMEDPYSVTLLTLFFPNGENVLKTVGEKSINQEQQKLAAFKKAEAKTKAEEAAANANMETAKQKLAQDAENKHMVLAVIGLAYLVVNFIAYVALPRLRGFFISTPLDLGTGKFKTEGQHATFTEKTSSELLLLLIVIGCYAAFVFGIDWNVPQCIQENGGCFYVPAEKLSLIKVGLWACLAGQAFFVIAKWIWGHTTSCPSCKTTFARVLQQSHDEPISTYEKIEEHYNEKYRVVYEQGTKHQDWRCKVCGHEWHTTAQYKKKLDGYKL